MTLKDLIADKKKVDEENNKHGLGSCNCKTEFICITQMHECLKESITLAKGISVATKLIEDEINFLEILYGELCIKYSNQHGEYEYKDIEDRIKYLKSLLEQ